MLNGAGPSTGGRGGGVSRCRGTRWPQGHGEGPRGPATRPAHPSSHALRFAGAEQHPVRAQTRRGGAAHGLCPPGGGPRDLGRDPGQPLPVCRVRAGLHCRPLRGPRDRPAERRVSRGRGQQARPTNPPAGLPRPLRPGSGWAEAAASGESRGRGGPASVSPGRPFWTACAQASVRPLSPRTSRLDREHVRPAPPASGFGVPRGPATARPPPSPAPR